MLKHPTLDKLHALKLAGMAAALADQSTIPDITDLSFEERLGLLVDREMTERDNRRMTSRLRRAKLRHTAILEDLDYRNSRGLDKGLVQSLAGCQWVKEHLNVLITGPTGVGKTWLACALAHKACREGYTAQYVRLTRLLRELTIAKGDGQYAKLLTNLVSQGFHAQCYAHLLFSRCDCRQGAVRCLSRDSLAASPARRLGGMLS